MKTRFLLAASFAVVILAGCSAGDSTMSKDELNALKNPSKQIPKEAADAMSNMGEMSKKQQEANAAAGVDARGVPINKSNLPSGAGGSAQGNPGR